MVRKVLYGALATAAVGTFVFGRDAWSYVSTGASSLRNAVRSEVPIEFEIERAQKEVDQLVPEIRKSMHVIAKEQVEVDQLQKSVDTRRASLEKQEVAILALRTHLKSGDKHYVVHGRSYDMDAVKGDLADRFGRYKVAEEALQADEQTLASRTQALDAHRETLENMLSQRKSLEVEIERLSARVRTLEARKTVSSISIDDSQLARCKALIEEIDGKLDVEEKLLDADANFTGLIPVAEEEEVPEDIGEQVDAHFGDQPAAGSATPVAQAF